MKTKHQYLLFFFWLALLGDCALIFAEMHQYRWFTKGALMPLLLLYFMGNAPRHHHLPSRILVIVALLLAWAGDLFLLLDGQKNFIAGLLFFLAMHFICIVYFWRVHRPFSGQASHIYFPLLGVAIFDLLVGLKLFPLAGELGLPLMVYMAVISVMFILACNILGSKKSKSLATQFFIPGAALFLASDAILGFNMFLWEDNFIGIAVMLTYGYAQHLIVHGFIKHVKGRVV